MNIDITDTAYSEKMKVLQALYEVKDPELNINIIDLGLVYDIHIDKTLKIAAISMTLSTPACPMGNIITNHAKVAVEDELDGYAAEVELVWEPRWSYDNISAEGRVALGL